MYRNVTEILVEEKLNDLLDKTDCCKCIKCREDIIAFALNRLQPKYISTEEGRLYAEAETISEKYNFDITKELAIAIEQIARNPRH